jgi:hypothetical protein
MGDAMVGDTGVGDTRVGDTMGNTMGVGDAHGRATVGLPKEWGLLSHASCAMNKRGKDEKEDAETENRVMASRD